VRRHHCLPWRNGEPTAAELQISQLVELSARLANEVESSDTCVRGAVRDELGDVLCADEECLELSPQRCSEGARASSTDLEASVSEELAGFLRESAFVWQRDAKHDVD
jgi:hypothetical protein